MKSRLKLFLLSIFGVIKGQEVSIVDKLDEIGYFDLIDNDAKKEALKEKIALDYNDDSNEFIRKRWLTFPNDYYISSKMQLKEIWYEFPALPISSGANPKRIIAL